VLQKPDAAEPCRGPARPVPRKQTLFRPLSARGAWRPAFDDSGEGARSLCFPYRLRRFPRLRGDGEHLHRRHAADDRHRRPCRPASGNGGRLNDQRAQPLDRQQGRRELPERGKRRRRWTAASTAGSRITWRFASSLTQRCPSDNDETRKGLPGGGGHDPLHAGSRAQALGDRRLGYCGGTIAWLIRVIRSSGTDWLHIR